MKSVAEFFPFLQQPGSVVITTHQKPDPDAMGSSLALFHFLKNFGFEVSVVSPTNWPDFLNWMEGVDQVIDFELTRDKAIAAVTAADYIFCLDFNTLSRTKNLSPHLLSARGIRILIDHHQQPELDKFTYGISDTGKSSTCEMIYDFIIASGYQQYLNVPIAECLYAGIMGDTGSFRFNSASASVHRMVAHLKELGLNHTKVHEQVYDNYHENRLRFLGHVLMNRMEVFYEYNTALISIPKKDLLRYQIRTGDTEGLVNFPLSIKGIKLAALVIDRDEERKWSFRSKGDFNTNAFAKQYIEGGGHYNASGGRSSQSLEETAEHFRTVLKENAGQLI